MDWLHVLRLAFKWAIRLLCWSITVLFIAQGSLQGQHTNHLVSPSESSQHLGLINLQELICVCSTVTHSRLAFYILLDHRQIETCMNLHIKVHRWNESSHVGKGQLPPILLSVLKPSFYFLFKSSSDSNLKQQPTRQTFASAHRGVPSEDLLPVSCKSAHKHCCGWWSVLSPSLPHWSNWKRKVPPLWNCVQVALSVCQSTGCEQLINNYCFYVLPQGQGCNLQQEEGFEWVWCLNYCWNIVTAYRFNCLSVRSLFHLDGRQLLCLHCLLIQQCGQYCDVNFLLMK